MSPRCGGSRRALLTSAHDLADGGLAVAVVESALRHGKAARIKRAARDERVEAVAAGAGAEAQDAALAQVDLHRVMRERWHERFERHEYWEHRDRDRFRR